MRLHIGAKDICNGVRFDSEACPIAQSLRRQKGVTHAYIGQKVGHFTKRGKIYTFNLTKQAQAFICAFDGGDAVVPFSFTMQGVMPS